MGSVFARLAKALGFPHPTMVFPKNQVMLEYYGDHSSETPLLKICFDAIEACKAIASKSPEDIKIVYSNQEYWLEKQKSFDKAIDYDWTYQSQYCGTVAGTVTLEGTSESIDYNRLKPSNPKAAQILFYDENCLYEDEMGDNGTSSFTIRLRVMPIGIFILVRNFVRVDKVVFKSIEHRYWIEFNEAAMGKVLKEKRIRQQSYEAVLNRLGPQDIKNEALVVEQLPVTECTTFKLTKR